jgi:hypothetical protein
MKCSVGRKPRARRMRKGVQNHRRVFGNGVKSAAVLKSVIGSLPIEIVNVKKRN